MVHLSEVCKELWEHDRNRLKRGEDYEIDLQGTKLFSFVRKLANIDEFPTYSAFIQLLNNYESETSVPEKVTAGKINKSRAFLNRCLESAVMEEAHSYLLRKGRVPQGKKAFKELLYKLWFELHPRPNGDGTKRSAFEHVFVGETCRGQVLGFHNWVQLYLEERQGNVFYEDFYPTACDDRIITINFTWKNRSSKTLGSFFLGTSPEFELAIYTVCFLAGNKDEVMVTLGNRPVAIVTSRDAHGHIGTCYPKLQEQRQLPGGSPDDVRIQVTVNELENSDVRERSRRKRSCCNCTIL